MVKGDDNHQPIHEEEHGSPAHAAIGDINDHGVVIGAKGGTELMMEMLHSRLPNVLKERFNIISSRVRKVSSRKKNILWLHDLPSDVENQHLKDPQSRARFAKIVFVSNWQMKQFEDYFKIKFENAVVMRNAVEPFEMRSDFSDGDTGNYRESKPLRLIYHTTPHRGLDILLPVFFHLCTEMNHNGLNIVLDVYSSFSIYGWSHRDEPFLELFDQCRNHPACNYHGAVPNDQIREALKQSHIFAYPSTWQETSCVAAIEAMCAGLEIVTSSLGALPETTNGFATMYPYMEDKTRHAQYFYQALKHAIENYGSPSQVKKRRLQQIFAAENYNWGHWSLHGRMKQWVLGLTLADGNDSDLVNADAHLSKFQTTQEKVEALTIQGAFHEMKGNFPYAIYLYKSALAIDPNFSHALVALGNMMIMMSERVDVSESDEGAKFLEHALTSNEVHPPLEQHKHVYYEMATRLAYYYNIQYRNGDMQTWLDKAAESLHPHSDCWQIFRASTVMHFPLSKDEAKQNLARFHRFIDELLDKDLICENEKQLSTAFPLAYYDDINNCDEYVKHHALMVKSFPWLEYQAQDLVYQDLPVRPTFPSRKIRVGVASSFFSPESSIWGNFGWTMRNLQSHPQLDISFIYYPKNEENSISAVEKELSFNPKSNIYLNSSNANRSPSFDSPQWMSMNRNKMEEQKFDVILYLDMFMNNEMNMMATSKLAPVQICTHGHPVTSGIPKKIMDYYLSWDLAELPDRAEAQSFYSEELYRIDTGSEPWEYYEPRAEGETSKLTGLSFSHYTRANLDFIANKGDRELLQAPMAKWYFCSQAPFKYSMVFDKILGDIQAADPEAVIILVQMTDKSLEGITKRTEKRLVSEGALDLNRVVFIPRMKHHHLMAMYKLSDVVLDSVYFGGDTTTREAFEVGAPVITLPGRTIGQRWTQAYYRVMGISDFIAKDPNDYVRIAVDAAKMDNLSKKELRKRIMASAQEKLYRVDTHESWADAIIEMAEKPRHWHWKRKVVKGVHEEF